MIALGFAILYSMTANSQMQQTETIQASTNLQSFIFTENLNHVDFGNLPGQSAGPIYLDPTGQASNYVGPNANQGAMSILAQANSSIHVEYDVNVALENEISEATLNYIPEFAGNTVNSKSTATKFPASTGSFDITISEDGFFYLFTGGWLGGTGTTPAYLNTQSLGGYSGFVLVTMVYN